MTSVSELAQGQVLVERYRLERQLGTGGMGVVWLACHVRTRRRVALKFVKSGGSVEQGRRLLREARAASVVRHPNIVEILDVVETSDGAPVIVMEHLEGRPLSALLIGEGKLSVERVAEVLLPVVSALGAAHAQGVVHRDIKPENVFLVEHPIATVKLLDFGVAKLTAEEGDAAATAALTSTGAIIGTPHYMAPEQIFGEREIDGRADIWALGLVMFRMLSGTLPTDAENVGQVMKLIVSGGIPSLAEVAPTVPADVVQLVDRMVSRSLRTRLSDLTEVLEVLRRYSSVEVPSFERRAQRHPVPEEEGQNVVTVTADGQRSNRPEVQPSKVGRRGGRPIWFLGVAVAIGAVVAASLNGGQQGETLLSARTPSIAILAPAKTTVAPVLAPSAESIPPINAEPSASSVASSAVLVRPSSGRPTPPKPVASSATPTPSVEPEPTVRVETQF